MYTDTVFHELSRIKANLEDQLHTHDKMKQLSVKRMSNLYGYTYIPSYYDEKGNEIPDHIGSNLQLVYNKDTIQETVAAIRHDVDMDVYSRLNYLDYIIVPEFKWNGQIYKNVQFDLISFNHYTRMGDTGENSRGAIFQMHRGDLVIDTWDNYYNDTNQNNCISALEATFGLTLKSIRTYMGEGLVGWLTKKVFLIDEREISHPIQTYTENCDNTMWPMPLFEMCPQYKMKGGEYWLFNIVYSTGSTYAACVDKDGRIWKDLRRNKKGIPLCFIL